MHKHMKRTVWARQEHIFPLSLCIRAVALPQDLMHSSYCMSKQGRYTRENVYLVFVFMYLSSGFITEFCAMSRLIAAVKIHEVNGLHALGTH